jgi:hypothetical protein
VIDLDDRAIPTGHMPPAHAAACQAAPGGARRLLAAAASLVEGRSSPWQALEANGGMSAHGCLPPDARLRPMVDLISRRSARDTHVIELALTFERPRATLGVGEELQGGYFSTKDASRKGGQGWRHVGVALK